MSELQPREKQEISPVNRINKLINNKGIQEMFENSLGDNAGTFLTSIVDLYTDPAGTLKECNPEDVIMEALKSATLKLPINKNLGFAYIIPYKSKKKTVPQFQIGYKGLIQLAMRSGQYKTINSNVVYEGMEVTENYLTGEIEIKGRKKTDKIIGYFSYFKLVNGFEKMVYWTVERLEKHAEKFSQSYKYKDIKGNVWNENFDEMALKTVTKRILSKYGVLSVEMQNAINQEVDNQLENDKKEYANSLELKKNEEVIDAETGEIIEEFNLKDDIQEMMDKAPF